MFIHTQMAKEKQNLLLVTFEKKWTKHVLNVTSSYMHLSYYYNIENMVFTLFMRRLAIQWQAVERCLRKSLVMVLSIIELSNRARRKSMSLPS